MRYTEQRARLSARWNVSPWAWGVCADMSVTDRQQRSMGYMLSGNIGRKWKWLQANLSGNYFHTDNYDSRLYAYERGVLQSFSVGSFWGHGVRCALVVRADVNSHCMLTVKTGTTAYFDRKTVGTALQTVNSSVLTTVDCQLRYAF